MKKIIAVLLVMLCLLSVVSCDSSCEKHVDADGNGVCDTCEVEFTCPGHVDADEDVICDECGAPYVPAAPAEGTVEAAIATLMLCYENSAPTRVYTETVRVVGANAYTLEGFYELVTGTFAGKIATVYTEKYEDLRPIEEGVDEILSEIKLVENKKEFLEGKGVRENGGSWNSGANFAPSAGSIALNINFDDVTDIEFTNAKYNNTVSFSVPKSKIKSVFGATDGIVNIDADSAVKVTITNNGATVTSITLSYTIKKNGDVPAQTVTISTTYSYDIQTLTIE